MVGFGRLSRLLIDRSSRVVVLCEASAVATTLRDETDGRAVEVLSREAAGRWEDAEARFSPLVSDGRCGINGIGLSPRFVAFVPRLEATFWGGPAIAEGGRGRDATDEADGSGGL